jgi:hypothetical protein
MKRAYERQNPSPITPTSASNGLWLDTKGDQEPSTPTANHKQLKFSVDNILNLVGQKQQSNGK